MEFFLPERASVDLFGNQLVKHSPLVAGKLGSRHGGARKTRTALHTGSPSLALKARDGASETNARTRSHLGRSPSQGQDKEKGKVAPKCNSVCVLLASETHRLLQLPFHPCFPKAQSHDGFH